MTSILDQFTPVRSGTAFRPQTFSQVFALRLARKLGDAESVVHYVKLVESCPDAKLIRAFRRTSGIESQKDLGTRFHVEFQKSDGNGDAENWPRSNLIALRVERRAIGVAIFYGDRLEYTDAIQLSSDKNKALASAAAFLDWFTEQFQVDSAAVENISSTNDIQRKGLQEILVNQLRDHALPIWEVSKLDLFCAFGQPRLRSRAELREVITTIWPVLSGTNSKHFIQDAVALGAHVQIERRFLN